MPYYLQAHNDGILTADSLFNGTDITVRWYTAFPIVPANKIAYNIYISADKGPDFMLDFFTGQTPTFVSVGSATSATITDFTPGQLYHFGVRATEYDPSVFDLATLPTATNGLKIIPTSLLSANISSTDSVIPLVDAENFPSSGTIKLGTELINYSSISGNNLILNTPGSQRGYSGSVATIHNVDGYNGSLFWDPNAVLWTFAIEDDNTRVFECWSRFDINQWSYTDADGYKQKAVDLLNTNLQVSDDLNQNFPPYDFAGYHRTNLEDLLNGVCVNSYIGGELGCYSDGYDYSVPVRGIPIQVRNLQRQEILLNTDGEPVILMKRQWTGVVCSCYIPSQEYPEARCNKCFGTGFVVGWQQYFSDRRSDGRIMVRFDPSIETVEQSPEGAGLESTVKPNCWTLTFPTLHERDFIVRFDQDGNEEFRYEIINVTRNKFLLTYQGMQRFAVQRVRKTDVIQMVKVYEQVNVDIDGQQGFNITRTLPTTINSSMGFPPHSHEIYGVSQNTVALSQLNTITSIVYGHSHAVENGIIRDGSEIPGEIGLGHIHSIIF
jgi:hypothetical protein